MRRVCTPDAKQWMNRELSIQGSGNMLDAGSNNRIPPSYTDIPTGPTTADDMAGTLRDIRNYLKIQADKESIQKQATGSVSSNPNREPGILEDQFYLDSLNSDSSSDYSNGVLVFDLIKMNGTNNSSINDIIQIEMGSFIIPDIQTQQYEPEYLFQRMVTVSIDELTTQAVYAQDNLRFHGIFNVTDIGYAVMLTPLETNRIFTFGRPVRDLSRISLRFRRPISPIQFPKDRLTVTVVPSTYPARFVTSEPHGLDVGTYIAPPGTSVTATPLVGGGSLSAGTYSYVVTYVITTAGGTTGETTAGPASVGVVSTAGGRIVLTAVPIGPSTVINRRIYRTLANGSIYKLVASISDNVTTTYNDTTADANLGNTLSVYNTTGGDGVAVFFSGFSSGIGGIDNVINSLNGQMVDVINSTTLQLTNNSSATFADIYVPATPVAAPTLLGTTGGFLQSGIYTYRVTFTTSWGETAAGPISANVTVVNNGAVTLSAIPTGDPNVTARRIYRSGPDTGGRYGLVATIADNTTTVYSDTNAVAGTTTAPTSSSGLPSCTMVIGKNRIIGTIRIRSIRNQFTNSIIPV